MGRWKNKRGGHSGKFGVNGGNCPGAPRLGEKRGGEKKEKVVSVP